MMQHDHDAEGLIRENAALREYAQKADERIAALEAELAHSQRVANGATRLVQRLEREIEEASRLLWITPHDDRTLPEMVRGLKGRAERTLQERDEARASRDRALERGNVELELRRKAERERDAAVKERDEERTLLNMLATRKAKP